MNQKRTWLQLFKPKHALVAFAIVLAPTLTCAQTRSGTLDTSFGIGGKVTTDFAHAADGGRAVVRQSDGRLVVAGNATINGHLNFALARYNSNGTLDTSFGAGGRVTADFGSPWQVATAVAVQPDGKIVVAGGAVIGLFNDFALARFNSNGTPDTTFGTRGKVLTNLAGVSAQAYSIGVQRDGKIVVAGGANIDGGYDFALVRYNGSGTLDASFGTGGKVFTDFGLVQQGFSFAQADSLAVQPDGRIVLAGQAYLAQNQRYDFALARYSTNGALDTTFGSGGKVITEFATPNAGAFSVAIQVDGMIVAGGFARGRFALTRYTTRGQLDANFGIGGKVTTAVGLSDSVRSLALRGDGSIVAAGVTFINGDYHSALAQYNTVGALDTNFGTGGKVTPVFGGSSEGVSSVATQLDGKVVAAGGQNGDFALARYN
jgi:uncharacterized delta-60 repeat protein